LSYCNIISFIKCVRYKHCTSIFSSDPVIGKEHLITDVSVSEDKVKVTTSQGQTESVDGLVITMPVPQLLQLKGDVPSMIGIT